MMHVALSAWYVRRFGRTANRRGAFAASRRSPIEPVRLAVAAAPIGDYRDRVETISRKRAAGACRAGRRCRHHAWHFWFQSGLVFNAAGRVRGNDVAMVGVCIGFAITLIVGIGVCFYDVSPQQNTFWRSRPINPDTWFWVKFFTGLIILVATLYIPLLVVVFAFHPDPDHFLPSNSATAIFVAQFALFAAAVATTCLVRHAVYAAILSIPLMYFGVIVVWIALKSAGAVGWINDAPSRMVDMS